DPDVTGQSHHEAAANRGAVEQGDERLRAAAHGEHDIADVPLRLHRGAGAVLLHLPDQFAGEVRAGAEAAPGAAQDDDPAVAVVIELLEIGPQRRRQALVERVEPLGPVQSDPVDRAAALDEEDAAHNRSTMVTLAMPPPSHIVCSPYLLPRFASAWIRVAISLVPEAPSGWPSAIAPPL